jgi:hypothetical protein
MKIKITHPINLFDFHFQAGEIIEMSERLAHEWIENEWACEYHDETIEVTSLNQETPRFIEGLEPKKKVTHGHR